MKCDWRKHKSGNYFLENIKQNEFYNSNYVEHFLILASAITGCISISDSAFLIGIPTGITSSAIGLKICGIAAGIKNSIIKKKKKMHDKIVLL